jgi:RimJ/RimL family protein N-acetyltransferase
VLHPGRVVLLREVRDSDLPALFAYQADPVAAAMAGFPSRDRAAFDAHWARTRADPTCLVGAVVADDKVVGNIGSWDGEDGRELGYWIGQPHWGRGIASAAVGELLLLDPVRPLHAHVVAHNVASLRVLSTHGFTVVATGPDGVDLLLR